jgi:hypothetical protein
MFYRSNKSIKLDEFYLVSDIVILNNKIIAFSQENPFYKIYWDEILINNKPPHIDGNFGGSGAVYLIWDFFTKDVIIKYFDKDFSICLESYPLINVKFGMMTLFKDDYMLTDQWIKYYMSKGIQHFFMYYNGKSTESERKILENYENVYWIDWDLPYHNVSDLQIREGFGKILLMAQPIAMNNCLNLNKDVDWLGFFDLDEFIVNNIKNILCQDNKIYCYLYQSLWADGRELNNKRTDFVKDMKKICVDKKTLKDRTKCFVQPKFIKYMKIHDCDLTKNKRLLKDYFIHFFYFSKNGREVKCKLDFNAISILSELQT